MKKILSRRILSLALLFALLLSMAVPAFAAEGLVNTAGNLAQPDETCDSLTAYQQLLEDGILGEDVTYEDWCALRDHAEQLEASFEASEDFQLVAELNRPQTRFAPVSALNSLLAESGEAAESMVIIQPLITGNLSGIKPGDIFITKSASSYGIAGHAGIAISAYGILHIAGPGKNPEVLTLTEWCNHYNKSWTKIYRHSNSSAASKAAKWAEKTYKNSSAKYKLTHNLTTTDVTYCSKIVWQAYYYGPDQNECVKILSLKAIALPYALPDLIKNVSLFAKWDP